MTTPAIISQFPIATPPQITSGSFFAPIVNHRLGLVFSMSGGNDQTLSGMRKHDAWPNGSELVAKTLAEIGVPNSVSYGVQQGWTTTYNSQLVCVCSGSSNSAGVISMRMNDLSYFSIAGFPSSNADVTPRDPAGFRMLAPSNIVAVQADGQDYIICTTIIESREVNIAVPAFGTCVNTGLMDQTRGVLGAVPDGSGEVAFIIGFNSTGNTANHISLYNLTTFRERLGSVGGIEKIADHMPADFDPTWSHIDTVAGIAVDQTDGNVIFWINNLTDVVTHNNYLVKLNTETGAIMWTLILPGAGGFEATDLQQALITQGKFYYLATNDTVAIIDTIAGVVLSNPAASLLAVSGNHPNQVSEDVTGSIYLNGGWSESATHPNYYGTWMGAGGNHTIVNAPMRYFPAAATPPAVPTPEIEAASRQRAWTFTLDGHKFYVLDLGTQGTLCYDTTTKSWAQFQTAGFWNWNFRNGTMWDQRIVGGDTNTPQIYEMSPSSMMDNDTVPITHVTTGGFVKRTRVYTDVAAVRLSVSTGDLDENGATVLLEFSDDQGDTWTAMDTFTLTEGDDSEELAWRSLGSFAAPGRIFRITDTGGFLRIDGCDAELDNFDEDDNSQNKE